MPPNSPPSQSSFPSYCSIPLSRLSSLQVLQITALITSDFLKVLYIYKIHLNINNLHPEIRMVWKKLVQFGMRS
jgi:hypothetical protein